MEETEKLLKRIERHEDLTAIRTDLATLLKAALHERRDRLGPWEKMHFEMAIALLPTAWLTLALTHFRLAVAPPSERSVISDEQRNMFDEIDYATLAARLDKLRD